MEEVLSSPLAGSALPGDFDNLLHRMDPCRSILGTGRGSMLGINTHPFHGALGRAWQLTASVYC